MRHWDDSVIGVGGTRKRSLRVSSSVARLRYRFDFFDLLDLLIMKYMKNVIDFQQILKSRSYKKTINDSNRDE
jgi:hypothetical protein